MTSSIGPAADLIAQLRVQLTRISSVGGPNAVRSLATGTTSDVPRDDGALSRGARAQAGEDLATAIARRVAALDKADPDRRRKAFRVFLEAVLLQEWGAQLINDPGFQQVVDSVQGQMEADAPLSRLMNEAGDHLLGAAGT